MTVFDDDHYYMAPVIANLLAAGGAQVSFVTTAGHAGEWSHFTGEQECTQRQLLELGVEILVSTAVEGFDGEAVTLACTYSGARRSQAASTLVLVTSREPEDALYQELVGPEGHAPGLKVQRIGDCRQPALIAHAVYAGYQAARELDEEDAGQPPPRDRFVI